MSDPIKSFLQSSGLATAAFEPTSRYHGLETAEWETAEGRTVSYVTRRFVPAPERFADFQEHRVSAGDRLDNLSALYNGDPKLYWRICDANGALRPGALVESVGARLRITLPEGIPEPEDD